MAIRLWCWLWRTPATALYDGTWTPRQAAAQIVINARATAPGLPAATAQIAGAVTPNNAPVLAHNSTANFYNPVGGAPLAPGTLIQITGQYLAAQSLTDTLDSGADGAGRHFGAHRRDSKLR